MSRNNGLTVLLAGIGVGAAAGLLLARYSGADLRKAIRRRANHATNTLKDQAGTLVDGVSKAAETGHDQIATQLAKGKQAARYVSKNAKDFIDTAADAANKATRDILDKASSLSFEG